MVESCEISPAALGRDEVARAATLIWRLKLTFAGFPVLPGRIPSCITACKCSFVESEREVRRNRHEPCSDVQIEQSPEPRSPIGPFPTLANVAALKSVNMKDLFVKFLVPHNSSVNTLSHIIILSIFFLGMDPRISSQDFVKYLLLT